jgi:hypothetical protein
MNSLQAQLLEETSVDIDRERVVGLFLKAFLVRANGPARHTTIGLLYTRYSQIADSKNPAYSPTLHFPREKQ